MARERFRQRQSARMFYQNKDHRDIIYDDKYINAIFKEYSSNRPDWREYKHHLVVGSIYGKIRSSGSGNTYPMTLDIDNRYISFISSSNSTDSSFQYGQMEHSDNFALLDGLITTNGQDFYSFFYDENPSEKGGYGTEIHASGGDMVAYISNSTDISNTTYVHFYEFEKFGHKEIIDYGQFSPDHPFTRWSHQVNYVGTVTLNPYVGTRAYQIIPTFQGRSENGIFLNFVKPRTLTTDPYEEKLYDVTPNGATLVHTFNAEGGGNNQVTFCNGKILYNGSQYCIVHSHRTTTTPRTEGVYIYWSNVSTPTQWNQTIVVPQENYLGSGIGTVLCHRNNIWYLYCSNLVTSSNVSRVKFRLYKSTNASSWTSVSLPTYFDIPLVENDETHGDIGDCPYNKVRLILNSIDNTIPTEEGTYNTFFVAPTSATYANGSGYQINYPFGMMFGDGQIYNSSPIDFVIGGVQYNSKDYSRTYDKFIYWYIDNMECRTSDGNFAFCPPDILLHTKGEVVQDDDYVFGTSETIIESEV